MREHSETCNYDQEDGGHSAQFDLDCPGCIDYLSTYGWLDDERTAESDPRAYLLRAL